MSVRLASRATVYDRYAVTRKFTAQETAIGVAQGSIDLIASRSEIDLLKNGDKTLYSWLSSVNMDLRSITLAVSESEYKDINGVLYAVTQARASIEINSQQIALKVSKDNIVSSINQSAEAISITAGKINLNGAVTANDYFKINTDGSMAATAGTIGGWTINSSAIYKDVTGADGTVYRAYFQPPITSSASNTWVLSCQEKASGASKFSGNFILYSDGSASFGEGKIVLKANGDAVFGSAISLVGGILEVRQGIFKGDSIFTSILCTGTVYGAVLSGIELKVTRAEAQRYYAQRMYFGAEVSDSNTYIAWASDNSGRLMSSGGFHANGSLSCSGTKSRAVKTEQYGTVLQYAYETAEPMFGDIGSGRVEEDGQCIIKIDPIFAETVTVECGYYVFLTKCGDGDLWVNQKSGSYFAVSGTPGLNFDWEIKAHQKEYEYARLESLKTE